MTTTPVRPDARGDVLAVAVVTGAHGIRGAVGIKLHQPGSVALQPGVPIELVADGGDVVRATVEHFEPAADGRRGRLVIAELRDRSAAEKLRGREILVARDQLPPLAPDEYYLADLLGCRVQQQDDRGHVTTLGFVIAVTSNGAQDLLEIAADPGQRSSTWLLPVVPGIVRTIEPRVRIVVDVPDGMGPDDQLAEQRRRS